MEKHYDPSAVESKWYPWWETNNLFGSRPKGEPYTIVIPPPNVTGILHMGHALNNTIQDVLVRWRRMQGRDAIWLPGTDHAGIATQNVVEKALRKEGTNRHALGREEFIKRVWQWREEYGSTIVRQLRKLGASCDWSRERFTLDEGLSRAVTEVFCQLYDEGLIYRGNYIVNWCPRCHTALSDEESEHQETHGSLWHIRYNIAGGGTVVVATTRPETMLGDSAVAVNPNDERYASLLDKTVILPILGRELKVVADDYVDAAFGTGVVKITPAHDPNDFLVAQRHNLPAINVMHGDGTMNEHAGPYAGMDRMACRKQLVKDLEAQEHIEKIEPHNLSVGHCYRCDTVVEPRLSKQWFVRMQPLAGPAIEAVRSGKVKFTPARWEKVYLEWLENIRDWCISRQIWWGHRIPVFTCSTCSYEWAARQAPDKCAQCGAEASSISQDPDVLDTWFSSWLWPFSTFGWPEKTDDLDRYYPTNDLATAPEIIFFWVARMIMAGYKFKGRAPFTNVYIHGTVRDDQGRKMSKSLGNSIDPLEIISQTSADALRFSLMMLTATGQDVFINASKFEIGRNFGTKIWNAARFMLMQMEKMPQMDWHQLANRTAALNENNLTSDDRHMVAICDQAIANVTAHLEQFRFQDGALALYNLFWNEYCDWYLEYAKLALNGDDIARREQVLRVMTYVFTTALKLLHPYMPFLTEEIWHAMGYGKENESIMVAPWPQPLSAENSAKLGIDQETVTFVEAKHALITAGRALRSEYNLPPGKAIDYVVHAIDEKIANSLETDLASLKALLRSDKITIHAGGEAQAMPGMPTAIGTIYLPLEGLIDIDAEKKRLNSELTKLRGFVAGIDAKLNNAGFMAKAPANVVQGQRDKREELVGNIERMERQLAALG